MDVRLFFIEEGVVMGTPSGNGADGAHDTIETQSGDRTDAARTQPNDQLDAYIAQARALGFSQVVEIPADSLVCQLEIRKLCNPDACPFYATSWICPPGCGELSELAAGLKSYRRALLLEYVTENVDTSDIDRMRELDRAHCDLILKIMETVRVTYPDALALTTGHCNRCAHCTYPDAPCRRPNEKQGALSAYGIGVKELCDTAGIPFSFAPDKLYSMGVILV